MCAKESMAARISRLLGPVDGFRSAGCLVALGAEKPCEIRSAPQHLDITGQFVAGSDPPRELVPPFLELRLSLSPYMMDGEYGFGQWAQSRHHVYITDIPMTQMDTQHVMPPARSSSTMP